MTKKHYETIARMFAQSYITIQDPKVRKGYNLAISDFIRFAVSQNPRFDSVKFAMATYNIKKH
jgi:hypothetical protein